MSYVSSCGLFRWRKQPGALPLAPVNMGAAFPVTFAFSPASQSAGQHETRARALIDAQNGPGHMAQQSPVCDLNCADPPSRRQRARRIRGHQTQSILQKKRESDVHYSNIAYDIVNDIIYYIIGDVAVGPKSHACGGDVEDCWFIPKRKQYNNSNFKLCHSNLGSDRGLELRINRF
jgi:hypothetical protein